MKSVLAVAVAVLLTGCSRNAPSEQQRRSAQTSTNRLGGWERSGYSILDSSSFRSGFGYRTVGLWLETNGSYAVTSVTHGGVLSHNHGSWSQVGADLRFSAIESNTLEHAIRGVLRTNADSNAVLDLVQQWDWPNLPSEVRTQRFYLNHAK